MKEIFRPTSAVREAVTILVFCFLIALVFNFFSSKGIPLLREKVELEQISDSLLFGNNMNKGENKNFIKTTVTTEQLKRLINGGSALLIDARNVEAYNRGHIPGAVNVPFLDVFDYIELLHTYPKDTLIIIYCEGGDCELSLSLTDFMKDMNFTRIFNYHDGIEGWQKENLPIETI